MEASLINLSMYPLPRKFYQRDTTQVAKELLGKQLFHLRNGQLTSGIITETEAYLGIKDPACHTFMGRSTKRVKSMYQPGGHAYVYFIYGMHFCFNVVTQNHVKPEAVLIRALYPLDGIPIMQKRRSTLPQKNLCSGPAKLCEALSIDRSCDGLSLMGPQIWIEEYIPFSEIKRKIQITPRIGIDYAGAAKDWPLRFLIDTL